MATRGFYYTPTGNPQIDRTLRALQDYLNSGLQPAVEGNSEDILELPTKEVASTIFFQPFDSEVHEDWTLRAGDTADVTYPSNGAIGGKVFRKDGGRIFLESTSRITFDPFRIYRLRSRFRAAGVIEAPGVRNVLRLPGTTGNLARINNFARGSTGDISMVVKLSMTDWTHEANPMLVEKSSLGNTGRWRLQVMSTGVLRLFWRDAGGSTHTVDSTVAVGFVDGTAHWVRGDLDVDNGASGHDVKFYTSDDGVNWTQLGTTITTAGTTSVQDNTEPIGIGARPGDLNHVNGDLYRVQLRNDVVLGPLVLDVNFETQALGATSFVEDSVNAQTVDILQSGTPFAEIVGSPGIDVGGVFKWGLQGIAADGTTVVDRQGGSAVVLPHVVGANNPDHAADAFQYLEAYVIGVGPLGSGSPGTPADPAILQQNVRYFRPYFEINPDGRAQYVEVDFFAVDLLTVDAEIDALLTANAPAEAGAQVFTGKDFALLANRFFENIIRASSSTPLSLVVSQIDDAGDLVETILMADGAGKRTILKGWQEDEAQDGDVVTFPAAFNNTPVVVFQPGGIATLGNEDREAHSGATITFTGNETQANSDHTISSAFAGLILGRPVSLEYNITAAASAGSTYTVKVFVDPDGASGFTEVYSKAFNFTGAFDKNFFAPGLDSLTTGGKVRIQLNRSGTGATTVSVDPLDIIAGPVGLQTVDRVRASDLTAAGFDMVAKQVEQDLVVTENTDNFSANSLTTEGATKELGLAPGPAGDKEYRVFFDVQLDVNSEDTLVEQDQNFPAGVLDAETENLAVALNEEASNDQYDVRYAVALEVTADATGTEAVTDFFPAGTLSGPAPTPISKVLSKVPAGDITVNYAGTLSNNEEVTVNIEARVGSGSWQIKKSKVFSVAGGISDSATFNKQQGTEGTITEVRVTASAFTADYFVDPDKATYTASKDPFAKVSATVKVQSSTNGVDWVTESTETFTVEDTDGVKNTLSVSRTKQFTRDAITQVRVLLDDLTITGTATQQKHEIDPNDVKYSIGSVSPSTASCEVAVDSLESAAWVERGVKTYGVTDEAGTGASLDQNGERIKFTAPTVDNIRVRLKSFNVTGTPDSSSVAIVAVSVKHNTFDGVEIEHDKTPLTSHAIPWAALAV